MIELYAAHRFKRRKKEKSITIQGDVVLRGIPATVMPGNRYGVYILRVIDCRLNVEHRPYRAQTS